MFYQAQSQAVSYREIWDAIPSTVIAKGQPAIIQDLFGYYLKGTELATPGEEICFIYWSDQTWADKEIGSGEGIYAGQEVYYNVASGLVTASPTGTIGTDYYFCGIAKRDALEGADQVLIEFIGDEWNHADRANTQA